MTDKHVRCAIYTRKSSEEGLEQSFNSLEAQREACESFIVSQKHEGWKALSDQYDDGGFSGGTIDRPALKKLLDDINAKKVDTVGVYKVDRLTRSLGDFSKIIDVFDAQGVSFVSVTQQFNTTSSMGRLTLNVLLSFAQFEREVTGERIRDKIAASKKKGMWMGGVVPHGYDCADRRLLINHDEAKTIREIFEAYARLGCVSKLKKHLDERNICSKVRIDAAGRTYGGKAYSRGALYHLLNNRVYIGEIVHRDECYPGRHEAIVPRPLWSEVAARLTENNRAHRAGKPISTSSLLTGKLFDGNGSRFTPTAALKSGKRYRYYTSQTVVQQSGIRPPIVRFPAQELENFVALQIHLLLKARARCTAAMKNSPDKELANERAREMAQLWPSFEPSRQRDFIIDILTKVTIGHANVWIEIDRTRLVANLLGQRPENLRLWRARESGILRLTADFQALQSGGQVRVLPPKGQSPCDRQPTPSLVKAIARARHWYESFVAGKITSVDDLVKQSGLTRVYILRIIQCACLSPDVVDAVLAGRHSPNLSLKTVLAGIPTLWQEQKGKLL